MAVNTNIKLVKIDKLKEDILKFTCEAPEIVAEALPGQFIEVKVTKTMEPFLRRPISIHNVNKTNNTIEFIFQVRGRGTTFLSEVEEGEMLDVIGPLGDSSFNIEGFKNIAIIGGGIGIFPLYELAKQGMEKANVNIYLGFRNKDFIVLEEEFKKVSSNLIITTDDGTYGEKGYAIDYLESDIDKLNIDSIFACGPHPMLKKVQEIAKNKNIPCQISLEERMACAIGACMGCSVKLATGDDTVMYARVCKDGPVFNSNKVEI
ncbi:MAG: dihydroorotate dehydrogenase electron transfer subunit [Oscillospiraceae bacterium]|nr:dihydroorotate dehydrogenase electron transfer subunit [Oscillospiraceae bacterium]